MATIGEGNLTLADWAKREDVDRKTATIVELLSQTNSVLQDAVWVEGNLPTGHRITQRTGLPSVYWRLVNQGTAPSKSTTAQVTEAFGSLEAWSEVDVKLANLNADRNRFRFSEATAFIEAMNQEATSTIFYGNSGTAPEEFNGFDVRYNSTSAGNGTNVVLGGASSGSDNSSIFLVVWGEQTCCLGFPRGSQLGLKHEDLGEVTVETTAGIPGARMRAYQDHYTWDLGLIVKDWRYVARVCNIDTDALSSETLVEDMVKAYHKIPNLGMGRPAFYMNRTVFQALDLDRLANAGAAGLSYADVDGKATPMFRQIPIRIVDAITNSEATYS